MQKITYFQIKVPSGAQTIMIAMIKLNVIFWNSASLHSESKLGHKVRNQIHTEHPNLDCRLQGRKYSSVLRVERREKRELMENITPSSSVVRIWIIFAATTAGKIPLSLTQAENWNYDSLGDSMLNGLTLAQCTAWRHGKICKHQTV